MNDPVMISMFVGMLVIVIVGGAGFVFTKSIGTMAEERLDGLNAGSRPKAADPNSGLLMRPSAIDLGNPTFWSKLVPNVENLNRFYEQADVNIPFNKFMYVVAGLSVLGGVLAFLFAPHPLLAPLGAIMLGGTPFLWLNHRKKKRIRLFLDAMPEAVELISRALRAGHGLASGMRLVNEEMKGPIAHEFGRVFEEQNLGIPIEMSLRGMSERIPTMDVRFFVIAVIIQRSTGGDLAEVLDKIGKLIRQRFELFGHVKALTAEGRLSGVVLLSLPPGLLGFLSMSNYRYVSTLFTDPLGNKMLIITAVMQVLGAVAIKKIISIKV